MAKDTHALSTPDQRTALEVLAASGVQTIVQKDATVAPTPVISWAIPSFQYLRDKRKPSGESGATLCIHWFQHECQARVRCRMRRDIPNVVFRIKQLCNRDTVDFLGHTPMIFCKTLPSRLREEQRKRMLTIQRELRNGPKSHKGQTV